MVIIIGGIIEITPPMVEKILHLYSRDNAMNDA